MLSLRGALASWQLPSIQQNPLLPDYACFFRSFAADGLRQVLADAINTGMAVLLRPPCSKILMSGGPSKNHIWFGCWRQNPIILFHGDRGPSINKSLAPFWGISTICLSPTMQLILPPRMGSASSPHHDFCAKISRCHVDPPLEPRITFPQARGTQPRGTHGTSRNVQAWMSIAIMLRFEVSMTYDTTLGIWEHPILEAPSVRVVVKALGRSSQSIYVYRCLSAQGSELRVGAPLHRIPQPKGAQSFSEAAVEALLAVGLRACSAASTLDHAARSCCMRACIGWVSRLC